MKIIFGLLFVVTPLTGIAHNTIITCTNARKVVTEDGRELVTARDRAIRRLSNDSSIIRRVDVRKFTFELPSGPRVHRDTFGEPTDEEIALCDFDIETGKPKYRMPGDIS